MVENREKRSSGVAKAALATAAAVGGMSLLGGGGQIPFLRGGYAPFGAQPVLAPDPNCGYVTDKDMNLIREIGAKDSVIARLEAEKYADQVVDIRTAPLNARICELETRAAVNAARDQDFRRYVEREFVHQPKASIRESIVVCKQCGCNCCCAPTGSEDA